VNNPHRLLFLDPAHFHAALTLRAPNPRVADDVIVYAPDGPDLRDFLALVDRFNRRPAEPTRWRPTVVASADPLARLVDEARGDVVVVAGRNGGKARTIRRLHEAGFHVLADKPWLVDAEDLDDVRASLSGWPLVTEIMTGRHDVAARLLKRLVDTPGVFGDFRPEAPAIELDGGHQLEKLVDGAPLRRPWWFFDVRVQGSGVVDIPTHVVDRTQWLAERRASPAAPTLVSARAWSTPVPEAAFRRITGEPRFPRELAAQVHGDMLSYACNAELVYRINGVTVRASVRWELVPKDAIPRGSSCAARAPTSTLRRTRTRPTGAGSSSSRGAIPRKSRRRYATRSRRRSPNSRASASRQRRLASRSRSRLRSTPATSRTSRACSTHS
jgi:predicted dehydrogenase